MACPEGIFGCQDQQWLGNLVNQAAPILHEVLGPMLAQAAQHQAHPEMAGATGDHPWVQMCQTFQEMMQTQQEEDGAVWKTEVPLKGFSLDEVQVKVDPDEGLIKIHAQHESGNESGFDRREAARYVRIQEDVVPESIKVSHQPNGILLVTGKKITMQTNAGNNQTNEGSKTVEPEKSADSSTQRKQGSSDGKKDPGVEMPAPKKFQFTMPEKPAKKTEPEQKRTGELLQPQLQQDKFLIELDVSAFSPDQLTVKVLGNQLLIKADGPEVEGNRKSAMRKTFPLPTNLNPDLLKSTLSPEGVLRVTLNEEQIHVPIDVEKK